MNRQLLFIGDIVGELGLAYIEAHLPRYIVGRDDLFVVANGENLAITGTGGPNACGMTMPFLERLLAAGVDVVTGGNHSWDGPEAEATLAHPLVIRPLNVGQGPAGRGAMIASKNGFRLGVINVTSLTAIPRADQPFDSFERQLAAWDGLVDAVMVDFHGDSPFEKLSFGFAAAGRVAAVLGSHTHVPTLDTRLFPGGTAYVTDAGFTGPGGGLMGYAPEPFAELMRTRRPSRIPLQLADGPIEFGAVLVTLDGARAIAIERVPGLETQRRATG